MTIRHLFSDVAPALNLDFANTKRLDPRITFTRSSTGTYVDELGVIKTAASNEARFDHDGSGNSLGLLIEEARTNLVQYSEDFSQTSQWSAANSTLTAASSITAPDGSTNTYKLVENALTGSHYVKCLPSNQCIAGTTYTYSMFVKAAERTQIMLHFDAEAGSKVYFDLSSGEIVSGTIGTIKAVGNGWYYCSVTLQPANNTEPKFYTAVNGSISTTGDGVSGVYIWGAQLEQASFPTSYIPTTGSTATRSADVASMTGTNFSSWYNQSEGTIVSTAAPFSVANNSFVYAFLTGNNYRIEHNVKAFFQFLVYNNAIDYTANIANYTTNQANSAALAYKENSANCALNGTLGTEDTSVTIPSVSFVNIGNNSASARLNGHISRLTYYDRRLTDAQLQALTL